MNILGISLIRNEFFGDEFTDDKLSEQLIFLRWIYRQ